MHSPFALLVVFLATTVRVRAMADDCDEKKWESAYECALQKENEEGWFWAIELIPNLLMSESDFRVSYNYAMRKERNECDEKFPGNPRAAYKCALKTHRTAGFSGSDSLACRLSDVEYKRELDYRYGLHEDIC